MKGFLKINDSRFYDIIATLVSLEFNQPISYVRPILGDTIKPIIDLMVDDTILYVETDYVDKIYRDSYYQYYSSKASVFPRNCIRLSFFINQEDLFSNGTIEPSMGRDIKRLYRGFMVLRPTLPSIVGRSALSPDLFQNGKFQSCLVNIPSTVDGFKVSVSAFPFSSQDTESISCAETTLWALMEYFGNKYAEYTPIKPSSIIGSLKNEIESRQLPSNGLSAQHLTYAIKSFGFGPQLYYKDIFPQLHNILGCYVESGIPVIVALSNGDAYEKGNANELINHAVLCIGHEVVTGKMIDDTVSDSKKIKEISTALGKIMVLDYDDIEKQFVFIDDNCPPYQLDTLANPTNRYASSTDWKVCEIENVIAPLYSKIYMESYLAKEYVGALIGSDYFTHLVNQKIIIRTYLCSTRSYKEYVVNSDMSDDMKKVIRNLFMPKFIWISEITDTEGLKHQVASNLIILDATGRQTSYFEPLLAFFTNVNCYVKDRKSNILMEDSINITPFKTYSNIH